MANNIVTTLLDETLKQTLQITDCLELLNRIILSVESVGDSSKQAATLVKIVSSDAKASRVAMESTIANNLNLQSSLTQIVYKLKFLSKSSLQIFPIVSILNQISIQINVLAVNIIVEASRAGKSGQAFTKIAEQITGLSNQTTQATEKIKKIVENIQLETLEIVKRSELTLSQLSEETESLKQTQHNLEKNVDISNQTENLLQSIFDEVISQQKNSQILGSLIKQVAQDLLQRQDFSSYAEQITQATKHLQQLLTQVREQETD